MSPTGIVTITESGLLQSYGKIGYATLMVSATDEYDLKQTLTFVVEVWTTHSGTSQKPTQNLIFSGETGPLHDVDSHG